METNMVFLVSIVNSAYAGIKGTLSKRRKTILEGDRGDDPFPHVSATCHRIGQWCKAFLLSFTLVGMSHTSECAG